MLYARNYVLLMASTILVRGAPVQFALEAADSWFLQGLCPWYSSRHFEYYFEITGGVCSVGRRPGYRPGGRGFESPHPSLGNGHGWSTAETQTTLTCLGERGGVHGSLLRHIRRQRDRPRNHCTSLPPYPVICPFFTLVLLTNGYHKQDQSQPKTAQSGFFSTTFLYTLPIFCIFAIRIFYFLKIYFRRFIFIWDNTIENCFFNRYFYFPNCRSGLKPAHLHNLFSTNW